MGYFFTGPLALMLAPRHRWVYERAMRNPNVCGLVAMLAFALVACGPSSKELSGAKTAHYKGDKLVLFAAAKAATGPVSRLPS